MSNIAPAKRAPLEIVDNLSKEDRKVTTVDQIVAMLPNAEVQRYFGPRRTRPLNQTVHKVQRTEYNHIEEQVKQGAQDEGNRDPFPPFNLQSNINCGQFVALSIDQAKVEASVPFYIGKVLEDGKS